MVDKGSDEEREVGRTTALSSLRFVRSGLPQYRSFRRRPRQSYRLLSPPSPRRYPNSDRESMALSHSRAHPRSGFEQRCRVMTDVMGRRARGSDKGCEDTRARGTVAPPDATPELGVPAEPARVWHVAISAARSGIMIRGRRTLVQSPPRAPSSTLAKPHQPPPHYRRA